MRAALEVAPAQRPGIGQLAQAEAEALEERLGVLGVQAEGHRLAQQRQQVRRPAPRRRQEARLVGQVPAVHDQLRAGRAHRPDRLQGRLHPGAAQVHRHALPDEEGAPRRVEARLLQLAAEGLSLEVDRDADDGRRRQRLLAAGEDARLAAAGGRVVDLEDGPAAQLAGEAIGAHVVAGAEEHHLVDPPRGAAEGVVDVAVPRDDEAGDAVGRPVGIGAEGRRHALVRQGRPQHRAEEPVGVRVGEDPRPRRLGVLVGADQADGLGGGAGEGLEHSPRAAAAARQARSAASIAARKAAAWEPLATRWSKTSTSAAWVESGAVSARPTIAAWCG